MAQPFSARDGVSRGKEQCAVDACVMLLAEDCVVSMVLVVLVYDMFLIGAFS